MENPFEHIEAYIRNELDEDLKQIFEMHMKSNTSLREAVGWEQDVYIATKSAMDKELKEKLIQVDAAERTTQNRQKIRPLIIWAFSAAASILLIITVFNGWNKQEGQDSTFEKYYAVYPNIIERSARGESEKRFEAFKWYDLGQYNDALEAFLNLANQLPNEIYPHFYAAICYLELESYPEALAILNKIDPNQDPRFASSIQWYRSLAQIKLGNIDAALVELRQIDSNSPYQSQAQELLRSFQ